MTGNRSLISKFIIAGLIFAAVVAAAVYYAGERAKAQRAVLLSQPQIGDLVLIEGKDHQFVVAKVTSLDPENIILALGKIVYPSRSHAVRHVKDASAPDYFSDEQMEMPRSRYTAENIQHVERPEN